MGKPQELLLLPGLLNDSRLWGPVRAGLEGRATIIVGDVTRDDSVAAMAARVLAEAPPFFALGGFSLGGYVALEILRQAPERVTRLALISTQARPDTPEIAKRRRLLIKQSRIGEFRGISKRLLPSLVHPSRLDDAALTALLQEMALAVGVEGFVRQETAIIERIDSRPFLEAVAVPTLIAGGREDQVTTLEAAEEMAALIPGSWHLVLERCGHVSPLEQPEMIVAAMQAWLAF
jgi:pimeloyl-ACP methyl ester carboxylesterase